MRRRYQSNDVTWFIMNELDLYPADVVSKTAERFGISPQAVRRRMRDLIDQGVLISAGSTRDRRYSIRRNFVFQEAIQIHPTLAEHTIFEKIRPVIGGTPNEVLKICYYGFTEMLNNVIDHSLSEDAEITVSRTPALLEFWITDHGVGIFRKIKDALNLDDERQSLLELSKGKMTTDREKHTGEGIFFTSRAFDSFSITSGQLYFWHCINHDDWLIENQDDYTKGTKVQLRISVHSQTKLADVFNKYTTPENQDSFSKTHIPISLAQYGDGHLVSRSQAKRVLARVEQFDEVLLDFAGVESIGQAFADEIFRIFRHNHPTTSVLGIRTNAEVQSMISRATNAYFDELRRATNTTEIHSTQSETPSGKAR